MDTALERLGRAPDGTVEVPRRWSRAGWYAEGARPGQSGSAVVLGHLDSPTGPAVFARLSTLRRGDQVVVARADRTAATFVVEEVRHHDRDRFPTVDVYFPTARPTLRLVTCGGRYVKSAGGYQQNVIVFARAAR
jgi:sortase (surface protein transpeptidase)